LVSPILVRPVREQLEHDRLVRLLQIKSRRRFEAVANPGGEQNAPVRVGAASLFPDLLLFSQDRARRLQAIVEVETGESVNHLEALAQWAPLSKLKVDFFLYVPANMVDVARRLCEDNKVQATEIWSYHLVGDQFRFTLMHRVREPDEAARVVRRKPAPSAARRKSAPRPARRKTAARSAAKSRGAAKPVRKMRPQKRR
jgi:hypothetical protein